ncbi:barH-like 2 homeobox protein [Nematostella vectensis]|nr:barH-like 2 homeobox protein [Nematostella vectensis]
MWQNILESSDTMATIKPTSFMIADILNLQEANSSIKTCAEEASNSVQESTQNDKAIGEYLKCSTGIPYAKTRDSQPKTCLETIYQSDVTIRSERSSDFPTRTCVEESSSIVQESTQNDEEKGEYLTGSTGIPYAKTRNSQPRKRPVFHPDVVARLEQFFAKRRYINAEQRYALAKEINMTEEQIKSWFHNKRTAMKRKLVDAGRRTAKLAYLQTLARKLLPANSPQDAMPKDRLRSNDITAARPRKVSKLRSFPDSVTSAHLRKASQSHRTYGNYVQIPTQIYERPVLSRVPCSYLPPSYCFTR